MNIARVVRPHGTKGEVLVAPLRGLPLLLEVGLHVHLTPPALRRERISTVKSVSPCPEGARVLFSCACNLDDAEALSGCYVLAATSDIELRPMDAAYDNLLGRDVIDERHGALGTIVEVMETPANDVWVISGTAFGEVLIPVIDDVVSSIPGQGPIPVRIMDGLLDL
jgi:16S rRNA processing protein RimM